MNSLSISIDEIEWSLLLDAGMTSEDIPDILKKIVSKELTTFEAVSLLRRRIYTGGTVYLITPFVVPFLLRIVEDAHIENQEHLPKRP